MINKELYVRINNDTINYQVLDFIEINNEIKALLRKPNGKIIIENYQNLTVVS
jgi:hypothetical protein